MQLRNPKDFWSGMLFAVTGVSFAVGSLNYSFGSSARPGPGYFPFGLGLLMAALGLVILLKAQWGARLDASQATPIAWRPLGVVTLSIVLFGLTLPLLGIALALPLLVIVISNAGDEFRWRDVLINAVVLTIGSWAVFVKALGLILPVWPAFVA